jgi:hypothetical protein
MIITLVMSIDYSAGYLLDSLENMRVMWNCISNGILFSSMFYHAAESHSKVINRLVVVFMAFDKMSTIILNRGE